MGIYILNEAGGQWHGSRMLFESATAAQERTTCEVFSQYYSAKDKVPFVLVKKDIDKDPQAKEEYEKFAGWFKETIFTNMQNSTKEALGLKDVKGKGTFSQKDISPMNGNAWVLSFWYQLVSFDSWFQGWVKKTGNRIQDYTFVHHDLNADVPGNVAEITERIAKIMKKKKDLVQKADIYVVHSRCPVPTEEEFTVPDILQWYQNGVDDGTFVGISLKKLKGYSPLAHVLNTGKFNAGEDDLRGSFLNSVEGVDNIIGDPEIVGANDIFGKASIDNYLMPQIGNKSTVIKYTVQEKQHLADPDGGESEAVETQRTCLLNIRAAGDGCLVDMFQEKDINVQKLLDDQSEIVDSSESKFSTPDAHIGSIMFYINSYVDKKKWKNDSVGVTLSDKYNALMRTELFTSGPFKDNWKANIQVIDGFDSWYEKAFDKNLYKDLKGCLPKKKTSSDDGEDEIDDSKTITIDVLTKGGLDDMRKTMVINKMHQFDDSDSYDDQTIADWIVNYCRVCTWYKNVGTILDVYNKIAEALMRKMELDIYKDCEIITPLKSLCYEYYLESKGINHTQTSTMIAHAPYLYLGN